MAESWQDRERAVQRYLEGFDDADIDAMLAVLEAAETDPELTDMITELHEEPEMKSLLPFLPKRKRKNDERQRTAGWQVAVATLLVALIGLGTALLVSPELQVALLGDALADRPVDCARTSIPEDECQTLLDLYSYTNGEEWHRSDNWLVGDPCGWYRVYCVDGQVNRIDLSNNGLHGSLPDLSALTELRTLSLSGFSATGGRDGSTALPSLPTGLRTLILRGTDLTMGLERLQLLTELEYLDLSSNNFSGPVNSLVRLNDLEVLFLENNRFSGQLPNFTIMPELRQVNVARNNFSGSVPAIANLAHLVTFDVSYNDLSGQIPHYDAQQVIGANFHGNRFDNQHFNGQEPTLETATRSDVMAMLTVLDTYMDLMAGGRFQTAFLLFSPERNDRVTQLFLRRELADHAERYVGFAYVQRETVDERIPLTYRTGGVRAQYSGEMLYTDGTERAFTAIFFRESSNDSWQLVDLYMR